MPWLGLGGGVAFFAVAVLLVRMSRAVARAGCVLSIDPSELARFLSRHPSAAKRVPELLGDDVTPLTRELAAALALDPPARVGEVNLVLLDVRRELDDLAGIHRTALRVTMFGVAFGVVAGFFADYFGSGALFGRWFTAYAAVGLGFVSFAFGLRRLARQAASALANETDAWVAASVPADELEAPRDGRRAESTLKRRRR